MSIASEIQRITGNVADAYTAASGKGATMPATQNSANLASTINTISTGITPTGTKPITANGVYDVTNYANADVQVPTTAPSSYLEFVNNNGTLSKGGSVMSLNGVTTIANDALYLVFYGTASATLPDFSGITTIDANGMYQSYKGVPTITGAANFSGLTTCAQYGLFEAFLQSGLTGNVDLSSLKQISTNNCFNRAFASTQITGVNLDNLETIMLGAKPMGDTFNGCTNLTLFSVPKLTYIYGGTGSTGGGAQGILGTCTSLTTQTFPSLKHILYSGLYYGLAGCPNLASLYFPAISTNSIIATNAFASMCLNDVNITIHFPSNVQTKIEALTGYSTQFGATSGTILFDLPSTAHLIGVNSVEYERNPKDDTGTALAWRVKDTGNANQPTIDWTPYYTSGTTDPQVGDTIYSDSACTTAVTTISAIA